jgi:hypothetical protein
VVVLVEWLHHAFGVTGSRRTAADRGRRQASATQPVIADGLRGGSDPTGWLAHAANDPAGQLAAGWHIYDLSDGNTVACRNSAIVPVAQRRPVLATELVEGTAAGATSASATDEQTCAPAVTATIGSLLPAG